MGLEESASIEGERQQKVTDPTTITKEIKSSFYSYLLMSDTLTLKSD